ncbi:peptidoglycan DD-metalloendopeptidase family protein [Candidatus Albibeggiatoa sp. nov. NOAA]|uniref:murein hydrolase activator EnvC family protein n=1 Tax=Candidatus Albibeggiatoa sp. nov. NOAA TaxID=3162724 RepID=UPI0032FFC5EA|nr:peptidoglycan DD-metalloendopeptidase family protein [Thiotrichaceae bacterium]
MNKLTFYLLLLWIPVCSAEQNLSMQQRLQQLEQQITELQAQMHNTRTKYGKLQQQLQANEENIGEVSTLLERLHGELAVKALNLKDSQHRQAEQQQKLAQQRAVLSQYIRSSYVMGHQDYLKLWLNQDDPFTVGRVLTYYNYFNRDKTRQIAQIKQMLIAIQQLDQTIQQETKDLQKLVNNQTQRKTELEQTHQQRQVILQQLEQEMVSQDKKLKQLQEDKRQLEQLISKLGSLAAHIPRPKKVDFASAKGQLSPPVQGKVIKQFGQKRVSHLKWQGLLIESPYQAKVRAVAAGRVIFAQWFRNLGLLVILDHQHGYMSLYGHNQNILVKTGDWVESGDIISQVGTSGGKQKPSLYFEIRYQGVPKNPAKWLRK